MTDCTNRLLPSPDGLEQAIECFGRKLQVDGRSPNTIKAYLRDLRCLARLLLNQYPDITTSQVTKTMIDQMLLTPEITVSAWGGNRSQASLHRFKAAIRSFFSWAEEVGLVYDNPTRKLVLGRLPRKIPAFLTGPEKRKLLNELKGRASSTAKRDRVILELFLGTGIRLQELVDLDIDDVNLDTKHIHVRAKGDIPQVKFLKTNLRTLLRKYLMERRKLGDGTNLALFLSNRGTRLSAGQVSARVKYWLKKAGVEKDLSPHSLRHTFATHLYAATSDLLVVKRALGHRDISTTEIYTHLVDDVLEEALERI